MTMATATVRRFIAAGCVLAAVAAAGAAGADDRYGYRLKDRNRNVYGGPTGVNIYPKQPYTSPLDQPRKPDYGPNWRAAPGLDPLAKPRRDLRPWRPR